MWFCTWFVGGGGGGWPLLSQSSVLPSGSTGRNLNVRSGCWPPPLWRLIKPRCHNHWSDWQNDDDDDGDDGEANRLARHPHQQQRSPCDQVWRPLPCVCWQWGLSFSRCSWSNCTTSWKLLRWKTVRMEVCLSAVSRSCSLSSHLHSSRPAHWPVFGQWCQRLSLTAFH